MCEEVGLQLEAKAWVRRFVGVVCVAGWWERWELADQGLTMGEEDCRLQVRRCLSGG